MSILTDPPAESLTPAERTANEIRAEVRRLSRDIAARWRASFGKLWQPGAGVTTNEILAALGEDAAEVFDLSHATVVFLMTTCQPVPSVIEGVEARIAMLPEFERHEDGTVTLADVWPVPLPEPEPIDEPEDEEEIELEAAE